MHTPGPWYVVGLDANGQAIVKAEHIEICTCWHHCVSSIEEEMHDNARLIAVAPELLEAARLALDGLRAILPELHRLRGTKNVDIEEHSDEVIFLRTAITKAEGKP